MLLQPKTEQKSATCSRKPQRKDMTVDESEALMYMRTVSGGVRERCFACLYLCILFHSMIVAFLHLPWDTVSNSIIKCNLEQSCKVCLLCKRLLRDCFWRINQIRVALWSKLSLTSVSNNFSHRCSIAPRHFCFRLLWSGVEIELCTGLCARHKCRAVTDLSCILFSERFRRISVWNLHFGSWRYC